MSQSKCDPPTSKFCSLRRWFGIVAIVPALVGVATGNITSAQITPDETLGNERSRVNPNASLDSSGTRGDRVDGGAVRGENLFHSFAEFNIREGQRLYFSNPDGIRNIISRVTGDNFSDIQGTLGVLGDANLFLLNPNGIVFGANASLDIRGSFIGSTADSLVFADGTQFSATNPSSTPLLTVSVPIGLQFGGTPGNITVQSGTISSTATVLGGLNVDPGSTLALIGGNLILDGGILTAPGGRVELGSVVSSGLVSLVPIGQGFTFGYDDVETFGTIRLTDRSIVRTDGQPNSGDIQVQARRLVIRDQSQMATSTSGFGQGGDLIIRATDSVELIGGLFNSSSILLTGLASNSQSIRPGGGDAGNITITTANLVILNGAQITSFTDGGGNSGNIAINASSIRLSGGESNFSSSISSETRSTEPFAGEAGTIRINTDRLLVENGAQILAITRGDGNAGNIIINASESVILQGTREGSFQAPAPAPTPAPAPIPTPAPVPGVPGEPGGPGGSPGRDAPAAVPSPTNVPFPSELFQSATDPPAGIDNPNRSSVTSLIAAQSQGSGNGGNLTLRTRQLILQDGGQLSATAFRQGDAGNVTIYASESIELGGLRSPDRFVGSSISAQVDATASGDGGNLTITTRRLTLRDGTRISVGTAEGSRGNGGNVTVIASESIDLSGSNEFLNPTGTRLVRRASALSGESRGRGDAGNVTVQTGELIIQDGGAIVLRTEGDSADAGDLNLTADSIFLDNGSITTETESGNGGDIALQLSDRLLLRDDSEISTSAGVEGAGGDGGNITIDASFVIAFPSENSDITANAFSGSGGEVDITAERVFGLIPLSREDLQAQLGTSDPEELDPDRLPSSDITAISQTAPLLSGQIIFNTPEYDPSQGLIELPTETIDTARLIAQSCTATNQANIEQNEFFITGRGGVPPSLDEPPGVPAISTDWVTLDAVEQNAQETSEILDPESESQLSAAQDSEEPIVEAQGWVVNADGAVVLVAEAPTVTFQSNLEEPVYCSTR
ncbi:MAG: S-layer family protein [Cyanobacteria bacterium CRU_2_1]|nr:S-layer family protein [Cyanobacteria bacterium RU_5_0]NJR58609.1 S-layer family protein [Cyanobacteria bacterium CRU_2_1]